MMKKLFLKIRRQDHPKGETYWEEFQVEGDPDLSVIGALQAIQRNPVNVRGEATAPVVFEAGCRVGMCGTCTMTINGKPAMACGSFFGRLGKNVVLEPLSHFSVLRDLVVDRSKMFADFTESHDRRLISSFSAGSSDQDLINLLSQCTACGACLAACPQYDEKSPFIGAAAIARVRLSQLLSDSPSLRERQMGRLVEKGGVEDCGQAQNCQKVCPQEIPLVESIAKMNREATLYALEKVFGK